MSHLPPRFLANHSFRPILAPAADPFALRGVVITPRSQSVELLVADSLAPVADSQLRASWNTHSARRPVSLLLAVAHKDSVSLCGPDANGLPSTCVLQLAQADDLCNAALASGDWTRLLAMFRGASDTRLVVTDARSPVERGSVRQATAAEIQRSDIRWRQRREFFQWSEFFLGQTHVLTRHPELLPQQAANQPAANAPARAGATWRERDGKRRLWFHVLNPPKESNACISVLFAHSDAITGCAFLPEGNQLVSASLDGTLRIWDVMSGRVRIELDTERSSLRACDVSPDGKWIAAGDVDGGLNLWSVASADRHELSRRDGNCVTACAFSPDARRLAAGYSDGTSMIFDIDTRKLSAELRGSSGEVNFCGFSPRGEWLIAAVGGTLLRWTADRPDAPTNLREHDRSITACAITPDQRWIVSAAGRELKLTSPDGLHKRSVKLRSDFLAPGFSPDGRWFTLAHGSDVEVQDARAEHGARYALRGHAAVVTTCRFSPDGRLLATCSRDGIIRLWLVERILTSDAPLERMTLGIPAVSMDGRKVATSAGSELSLWERGDDVTSSTLPGVSDHVFAGDFSPNGWTLAAADAKVIRVWRSRTPGPVLKGHRAEVSTCAFSADGGLLASGSRDHTVRIWDAKKWSYMATLDGHTDAVNTVLFHVGRETTVISASDDFTIRQWSLTGKEISRRKGHTGPVLACGLSPDYRLLASGSDDATVRIWKTADDRAVAVLEGHGGSVRSCAFSSDGRWLVSHSDDGSVRVWEMSGFRLHAIFTGVGAPMALPAFAPDGAHLVQVMDDCVVLWNVERKIQAGRFFADGRVSALRWSPSGCLALGTDSGVLHVLAIENLGALRVTPWRESSGWNPFKGKPKPIHFGCPRCRAWSSLEGDVPEGEIVCSSCGAAIRLNPFHIEADWSRVAAAWAQ